MGVASFILTEKLGSCGAFQWPVATARCSAGSSGCIEPFPQSTIAKSNNKVGLESVTGSVSSFHSVSRPFFSIDWFQTMMIPRFQLSLVIRSIIHLDLG